MEMEDSIKDHTQIDIKQFHNKSASNFVQQLGYEPKIPFFKSSSRKKQDTWIISVFFILHLVAFFATMFANNCWTNSHAQCELKSLGRFSFQPLSENPLLGPSSSTLDEIGALRQTFFVKQHQTWRLFTSMWLHAGLFHLIINLSSVIFIGILLEQEFGPLRVGIIYILSAISGSLTATFFLTDKPSVTSSGALFGLLGTTLSSLLRNWKLYANKIGALVAILCIGIINLGLGLLPYINNFSSIGGFISGLLLGFVLLFSPQLRKVVQTKGSLFDHDVKFKQKLDKPALRIICFVVFGVLFVGSFVASMHRFSANEYCSWCQYIDCVPSKWWSCSRKVFPCESVVNVDRLTLTCTINDNFKVFPFADLTQARLDDLCSLICS